MKDTKKQTIILSVVAIATFAILIIGATYAYFQTQTGGSKSTDVNVTTYTTDVLTFTTGEAINIAVTQSTFASGKGNAVGSTFAKASLIANNKTNTSTKNYYVYLNIEDNTFEYSVNESTPELILTVTDNNGNEVTDISGLIHTSVTDGSGATITGYDITTATGVLTLFNNREITANPTKEEQWNIKLTFINYNKDQSKNAGAKLSAKIKIQKEEEKSSVAMCNSGTNLAECIKSQYTGTQGDNSIYFHNGTITSEDGTVIDANDSSYRYAGASESVNNFVCFGSDETPCPTDNLHRIIGVFDDKVKLIKYDYANSNLLGTDGDYNASTYSKNDYSTYKGSLTTINRYYWNNSTQKNTWSESELNKTNLNKNYIAYLNNIDKKWAKKISTTTWKVGGNAYANIVTLPMYTIYQNEIKNPKPGSKSTTGEINYEAQIGLMYVSDYGYAASPTYWTYVGWNSADETKDYRAATSTNWMYMGYEEWTISRNAAFSDTAFGVYNTGVVYGYVVYRRLFGVRPSFNLLSSITYVGGSGTQSDPILIN